MKLKYNKIMVLTQQSHGLTVSFISLIHMTISSIAGVSFTLSFSLLRVVGRNHDLVGLWIFAVLDIFVWNGE